MDDVTDILTEIMNIEVDDGVIFMIKRVSEIMDEAEYPISGCSGNVGGTA